MTKGAKTKAPSYGEAAARLEEILANLPEDQPEVRATYGGTMFRVLRERLTYVKNAWASYHHPAPIEGASGCIRACMIHLEETGRIKAQFANPFRKKRPWSIPT